MASHLWITIQWRTRDKPWVVLGDFNVVKDSSESFGGLSNSGFKAEFANWMGVQGLFDHPYIDVLFSWSNKRDATIITLGCYLFFLLLI